MKVKVSKRQGISQRIKKGTVKGTLSTSIKDRMLIFDHQVTWEDFRILGSESNKFILELKENWLTKRDKSTFSKKQFFQELILL